MSERHDEIDARLERLRRSTEAAAPRGDFAARVAARIEREGAPMGWAVDLWRPARRFVPIAAVAAALGLVWAAESARTWRTTGVVASTTELDTEW